MWNTKRRLCGQIDWGEEEATAARLQLPITKSHLGRRKSSQASTRCSPGRWGPKECNDFKKHKVQGDTVSKEATNICYHSDQRINPACHYVRLVRMERLVFRVPHPPSAHTHCELWTFTWVFLKARTPEHWSLRCVSGHLESLMDDWFYSWRLWWSHSGPAWLFALRFRDLRAQLFGESTNSERSSER